MYVCVVDEGLLDERWGKERLNWGLDLECHTRWDRRKESVDG